jgi:hypothetical protein
VGDMCEEVTILICDHCGEKINYKETEYPSPLWLWEWVKTKDSIYFHFCGDCWWSGHCFGEKYACFIDYPDNVWTQKEIDDASNEVDEIIKELGWNKRNEVKLWEEQ